MKLCDQGEFVVVESISNIFMTMMIASIQQSALNGVAKTQTRHVRLNPVLSTPARPLLARRQFKPCRSTEDQEPATKAPSTESSSPMQQQEQAAEGGFKLREGQGTALVTGGISIIIAVLYLGLVFAMDMRGGELLPPPPEAFIP